MYSFFVNGCQVSTSKKQSLLRFLRDEMHLTSVKDGCSQGACGACTVLIDGETCKACVPQSTIGSGSSCGQNAGFGSSGVFSSGADSGAACGSSNSGAACSPEITEDDIARITKAVLQKLGALN